MDIENVICFWGFCDDETLSEHLKLVSEPGVGWLAYLAALLGISPETLNSACVWAPVGSPAEGGDWATGPSLGDLPGQTLLCLYRFGVQPYQRTIRLIPSKLLLFRECQRTFPLASKGSTWLFCLVFAEKVLRGSTVN